MNACPEYTTFNSLFVSKLLLRQKEFQAKFCAIFYVYNIDSVVYIFLMRVTAKMEKGVKNERRERHFPWFKGWSRTCTQS